MGFWVSADTHYEGHPLATTVTDLVLYSPITPGSLLDSQTFRSRRAYLSFRFNSRFLNLGYPSPLSYQSVEAYRCDLHSCAYYVSQRFYPTIVLGG